MARADFRDFSRSIPNASSSFGSTALLAELDTTLKQFPTVTSTVYSFDGDVRAFYEWLQLTPPVGVDGDAAAAVATARRFLGHVVGMHRPAGGEFRGTGADEAEIVFWARSPHGAPLRDIATVVSVRRDGGGWTATGSTTSTILVDTPTAGLQVTSPVVLRGRSVAFEGSISVRVLAERAGGVAEIGRGFVTGGGDALGPFSGQVDIQPPGAAAGWVVLFEESAADGSVVRATTVPVRFASAAKQPAIHEISWQPELALDDGWLRLPDGPGTVTCTVQARFADRVELFLTPTGTGTAPLARSLGTGTRTDAGFVIAWSYPDEPQLGHLSFVATGPGGRSEDQPFDVSHD